MCLPECVAQLSELASRRSFLKTLGLAAGAGAAVVSASPLRADEPARISIQRVVDLTHTLHKNFPMPWEKGFDLERLHTLGKDKFNQYRWHLNEHIGTHMDAPLHFTDGISADKIAADQLVGPLVVVDLRERAAANPDTELTAEDLKAWERKNGPIPAGAIVAMNSGWDAKVDDSAKFFGHDDKGRAHFPGFHLDAVQFLHQDRNVKGIATDTMSLDRGNSGDFPVHRDWLGHGKWGIENIANLSLLPISGATIVVGSPKISGCTGGPSRILALV